MKKVRVIVFGVLVFTILIGYSQNLSCIKWNISAGGNRSDYGEDLILTDDGGYLVAGATTSTDVPGYHSSSEAYPDFFVAKFDHNRNLQWQHAYGGTYDDVINDAVAVDDGYVLVGYTYSGDGDIQHGNHGQADYWIVKIDTANGNILWERTYGGNDDDRAYAVEKTEDGNIIVTGYAMYQSGDIDTNYGYADCWTLKLSSQDGSIIWQKSYGGTSTEVAKAVKRTSDNNYVFCGYTLSNDVDVSGNHGVDDIWVYKTDAQGNLIWQLCIGGSDSEDSYEIRETPEGDYVLAGKSTSSDGDIPANYGWEDFILAKVSSEGNLLWVKNYGGTDAEEADDVKVTYDGGYILCGESYSHDIDVLGHHNVQNNPGFELYDAWVVKTDKDGNIQWNYSYGSNDDDGFTSVEIDNDGKYVFLGWAQEHTGDVTCNFSGTQIAWLVKMDISYIATDLQDSLIVCDNQPLNLGINAEGTDSLFTYQWYFNGNAMSNQTGSVLSLSGLTQNDEGLYYCSVSNSCGSENSNDLYLSVAHAPDSFQITGPQSSDEYEVHTYAVPLNNEVEYHWSVVNGTIVSENSNNSVDIMWNTTGYGYIYVVAVDTLGGCQSDTMQYQVTIGNVFEQAEQTNNIEIFPNPLDNNVLNVRVKQVPAKICIYNSVGLKVLEKQIMSNENRFEVTGLQKGFYIYEVMDNNNKIVKKGKIVKL